MSDTIEVGHQRAKMASLRQRRPNALIDAMEGGEISVAYPRRMKFYGGGPVSSAHVIGTGAIGSAIVGGLTGTAIGTVVLVYDDYPTGGPSVGPYETAANLIANSWARWTETTREFLQQTEADETPNPSAAAKLRVSRLTAIQGAFGLPTLAMAAVLGITRQGLYKWLDASKDMTLQEASRERLARVERLAKLWRERSTAPLSSVAHEPLALGQTVLDMLTQAGLDEVAVVGAFDDLVVRLQGKPRSRSQKLVDAGFKRRPSPRTLPADE